jgi:hypothetical protein
MAKRTLPIDANVGPTDRATTSEFYDNLPELLDRLKELKAQGFTAITSVNNEDQFIGFCCFRQLKTGGDRTYNLELENSWEDSYQPPEVPEDIKGLLCGELSDPM